MRRSVLLAGAAAAFALGCSSDGGDTSGPSNGGGGAGGGPVGTVTVGDIFFQSGHNGTRNPAQDTVAAGQTVTWTWSGSLPHTVRSQGTPAFPESDQMTGSGTYMFTFTTPGTYHYDCGVHGAAMSGTIVVQ